MPDFALGAADGAPFAIETEETLRMRDDNTVPVGGFPPTPDVTSTLRAGAVGAAPATLTTRGLTLIEIGREPDRPFVAVQRAVGACGRAARTHREAKTVCRRIFGEHYPDYAMEIEEPCDANACILYARSATGEISSMLRVSFDSPQGLLIGASLPGELDTLRRYGLRLAEPGRFAIAEGDRAYKSYLRAAYQLARHCRIDLYLLQARSEHAAFYRRTCGAFELDSERAPPGCQNLAWHIGRTPPRFFRAFGREQHHLERFLAAGGRR